LASVLTFLAVLLAARVKHRKWVLRKKDGEQISLNSSDQ
jgi:hypothetical protein